jgi:hypothetical protein
VCATWFLAVREEHRLRMYEYKALSRIFEPKRRKWREAGEDSIMRSFITCTLH